MNECEKMLETLVDYNDSHNAPLYNENLWQAVSKVTEETEEEERNVNNSTIDNFCQYLVPTNTQIKNANVPNERRIYSDILSEMIKGFKGLTLQSTIKILNIIIYTKMTQKATQKANN